MKKKVLVITIVLLFVSTISVAYALQINVDGDPSDWVPEASVATSPPIPGTLHPGSDIAEVFFTNDRDNFYWRIDTYADPQWSSNDGHFMQICMNTDNDTSTGAQTLNGCNVFATESFGFDYSDLSIADRWECTMKIYRAKGCKPAGLNSLCNRFDIELDHHEALSDARGCAKLYLKQNLI